MAVLTTPTISSSSRNAVAARQRPDLKAVVTRHKHESAVVVKDPIAMKYHRLRPDEYFVLEKLDGCNSLEQIREEYEKVYAPQKVTTADLNQLLFRFHQSGLTLSDAAMQGDRLTDRRRQDQRQRWMQHISGVLFIRFPGVDPEPLLKRVYPLVRPLLGWLGLLVAIVFCLAAAIVFATHCDRFATEFPRTSEWIRWDSLLILGAVIGCTKVFHEIGHAVMCKRFGGECHQIGPMLLVFTPALYCDTSDSWMLPSRWQRAAVGMAGVGTEVVVAAIATFIWVSTAPGLIHHVAMNVMLVCSASTLLFNANPLLRYDGYYVLSDLCDVPNLGERSRKLLAGHTNKLLFGLDELPDDRMTPWARFWMLSYAVLAVVYRWSLTLLILWVVSLLLRPYGLESLGRLMCLFAAGGMVYTLLRPPVRFLRNPARRKQIHMTRTMVSAAALAGLIALAFCPLPSGVNASARIIPRQESSIYISTPGLLGTVKRLPGETVSPGDEIAELVNHDVEMQYVTAKGRYETQRQIVESIRWTAIDTPDAANELPAQEALLADLREQLETRKSRRAGLVIRAPTGGRLIAAPRRRDEVPTAHRLVSWSGYPTDPQNQGCFLEPGNELMSIARDENWDAELILGQAEVERVIVGATVKLALEGMPQQTFLGKVTDISRAEWTAEQNAERRDDPDALRGEQPPSTSYMVRVELDPADALFVTGATATSRIEAPPISLAGRVSRFLNGLFRFR